MALPDAKFVQALGAAVDGAGRKVEAKRPAVFSSSWAERERVELLIDDGRECSCETTRPALIRSLGLVALFSAARASCDAR